MKAAPPRRTAPAIAGAVAVSDDVKRAVIYLRVSTAQQAKRDGDPEGYSIPAQREACRRKAENLGAIVIEEYVDRGASATSTARSALRQMLDRVTQEQDVDYVIVHKVDRLARNRLDDATIGVSLKAAGAQLVSVTENIDGTAQGVLMHGIMATIAEFYSNNLRAEILKGTVQKAQRGGTPYMAPLGYENVRNVVDGAITRTVELDPIRAPLMRWAFETYAGGGWSLSQLLRELTDRGLTNRASANRPERPVHLSRLHKLMRDSYYIGIVTYRGVQYEGKHVPLISPAVFDEVQSRLSANRVAGEKNRLYTHYLKGTVYCGRCAARLGMSRFNGHGGAYDYFFCLGRHRQRTVCDMPYLNPDEVALAVERHWAKVARFTPSEIETIRQGLVTDLRRERAESGQRREQLGRRIAQIEQQRRSWAEKTANGSIPEDIGREKQNELTQQLVRAKADLAEAAAASADIEPIVNQALDLARDCVSAYGQADDQRRREWCQLFFEWLRVDVEDVESKLTAFGEALVGPSGVLVAYLTEPEDQPPAGRRTYARASRRSGPEPICSGQGLKVSALVRARGFEPPPPKGPGPKPGASAIPPHPPAPCGAARF
jgi:site-specific DNA recombinase